MLKKEIPEIRYKKLVESAPDSIVIVDGSGTIQLVNDQTRKLFGYEINELEGKKVEILIPERYLALHTQHRDSYSANPRVRLMGEGRELMGKRKDGTEFPVEIALSPIESDGELLVSASIRDNTERKKAEVLLKQSEERFKRLIESAPDAMVIVDGNGVIQLINEQTERLFGYTRKDLLGRKVEILVPEKFLHRHKEHREAYAVNPKKRLMGEGLELMGRREDGSEFPIEIALSPIATEPGSEFLIAAAIRDITIRKKIENEMREMNYTLEMRVKERTEKLESVNKELNDSLSEKVTMLQEIHHRVKNNLQTVSSLLRIQSDKIEGSPAVEYLKISEQRIRSMALIHIQLYKTKDFSKINFKDYTEELCRYLLGAYGLNDRRIRLETDINDVFFSIDVALPCGLIINELFTNALKHAFPDSRAGKIEINIYKDSESVNHLIFKDDGVGAPETFMDDSASKLGMLLVSSLTEQLEGKISTRVNKGTEIHIEFTDIDHKSHYRT